MKLVTFQGEGGPRLGALRDGEVVVDLLATDRELPGTMKELVSAGSTVLDRVRHAVGQSDAVCVSSPRLLAPIANPQKVVCIGLNYKEHAEESGAKLPSEPVVFNKFPSALVGLGDAIVLPTVSSEVDFEAELVAVIGRRGRNIAEADALDYVFGYSIGNDVSARDWQLRKDGKQWLLGKSFDTFAPLGPCIVTADELPDPQRLNIELRLNGEVMQSSNTGLMIFPIARLLAYVSQVVTLEPGDLLFTGTPPGVGFARQPPRFLQPGDECEIAIEGIGVLHNRCVSA